MTAEVRFPSYRAPQADRQILCVPSWATIRNGLSGQRQAIANSKVDILGVPLGELASAARQELLAEARTYTQSYTTLPKNTLPKDFSSDGLPDGPLIITGHQPNFVHPGVWLKNFAAGQLAEETGGTAINLIIDNDLCRSPSVRVPTGAVEQPRAVDLSFDQLQQEMPYEERALVDRSLWNSFGERVAAAIAPLVSDSLLTEWWPQVVKLSESNNNLGLAIAQARHCLQQQWGNQSLEIPQSHVCQTPSFHRFALYLLTDAARLRSDYNGALAEYRQVHRLRSAAQPLPDLTEAAGWTETPFWIWTESETTRRALFVKPSATGLQLSDRQHWQKTLPLHAEAAMQQLADWQSQGIKLRTRALITTLYARLLLADTFIHGIGGAKYDQVTDEICQRFFGVAAPGYVTLSGTLRLPIDHTTVSPTRSAELRQKLRAMRYHPEDFLDGVELSSADQSLTKTSLAKKSLATNSLATKWVDQKIKWVQTEKTSANAAERHAQIHAANEALQVFLLPQRQQIEGLLAATIAQTRTNQLLESREYPFCLFPRDYLRDFLLDFSREMP